MSISDLKIRLADVPGIENLTMTLEAGRIVLRWAGYSAAVDASASDYEIEVAIRNAIKLPAVSMIPDKPAASVVPATQTTGQPMTTPATAGFNVQQMMEQHVKTMQDIHVAQLALLQASLDRQVTAVTGAVTNVAIKIDGQTEEFLSMMGQFTNSIGV
jgi:hypothetical protein